eukprot:2459606-Lingulodinium_polyedra.AAC.1
MPDTAAVERASGGPARRQCVGSATPCSLRRLQLCLPGVLHWIGCTPCRSVSFSSGVPPRCSICFTQMIGTLWRVRSQS